MPAGQTISPTGVASGEALGEPTVAGPVTVTGIGSGELLGRPMVLNPGTVRISPSSCDDGSGVGEPTVTLSGPTTIHPAGIG